MSLLYGLTSEASKSNSLWLHSSFQAAGLPFAAVLTEKDVDEAMAAEGVSFGELDGSVYTPALTIW